MTEATQSTPTPNDLLPDSGCVLKTPAELLTQFGTALIEVTHAGVDLPVAVVSYDEDRNLRIEMDWGTRLIRIVYTPRNSYIYYHEHDQQPGAIKNPTLADIKKYLCWIAQQEPINSATTPESIEPMHAGLTM